MRKRIFSGTVTKLGSGTVYVDNHHKVENQLYVDFIWPNVPFALRLQHKILDLEIRRENEDKELMNEMFMLRNELKRQELI